MPLYARYGLDYTAYPFPQAAEVITAIREVGGAAVLAHPGNYFSGMELASLYTTFNELCALGLGGIEAYYPRIAKFLQRDGAPFAEKKGLLITSGSDDHGLFAHSAVAAVSHRLPDDGTAPAAAGQFGAGRMSENLHQFYTTFGKKFSGRSPLGGYFFLSFCPVKDEIIHIASHRKPAFSIIICVCVIIWHDNAPLCKY